MPADVCMVDPSTGPLMVSTTGPLLHEKIFDKRQPMASHTHWKWEPVFVVALLLFQCNAFLMQRSLFDGRNDNTSGLHFDTSDDNTSSLNTAPALCVKVYTGENVHQRKQVYLKTSTLMLALWEGCSCVHCCHFHFPNYEVFMIYSTNCLL